MAAELRWSLCLLFSCLLPVFMAGSSPAAQSAATGKVVAEELKTNLRRQVLGEKAPPLDPEYLVGAGDILAVSVYGEGSMATGEPSAPAAADKSKQSGDQIRGRGLGIEVRVDGRASLLHLGDVPVAGMTMTQLADYLQQLYKSIYGAPLVSVTLLQSNSRRYTIMGQVVSPGLYYLDFPLSVVQAVARAGGFTEWAKHDITVIRPRRTGGVMPPGSAWGKEGQTLKFRYDDFLKGENVGANIAIQPDDIMVVH